MFDYIRGTIEEVREDAIVLDHDGIGFLIFVPATVLTRIAGRGADVTMHTYFHVTESVMTLFGFLDREDKRMFELLLGVKGVGPKAALSILGTLPLDELRFAVLSGDAKAIARSPGIGSKTAQQVILDLKDKIDLAESVEARLDGGAAADGSSGAMLGDVRDEAILALTALGYGQAESYRAVRSVEIADGVTTEEILKAALKNLAFI